MSDNPNSIEDRLAALETTVIALLEILDGHEPEMYKSIIQKLNAVIRACDIADDVPDKEADAEHPRSAIGKGVKALRDQFKAAANN